ncbi:MAG: patatin-like phospholipase family protein [Alphaproteobacteria bacterium]|nr:patatin-like phospholipase family protein [Alphaproteobacteria bacterium]
MPVELDRDGRSRPSGNATRYGRRAGLLLFAVLLAAGGCAGDLQRKPVPIDQMAAAEPPNEPNIRAEGLALSPVLQADLVQSLRDESEDVYCKDEKGEPTYCSLALSGGGGYGAFGAGFLNGWTAAGTRPTFKVVTGISTGALVAPFAFVGPDRDQTLEESFTTVSDKDIYTAKGMLQAMGDESFMDSAPLAALIAKKMDDAFIQEVAKAHAAGRRLMIGTVNMDAQRFVVWNMGAIASSSDPDAPALFRKVVLASASMPGIFPPTYIDVELDGVKYDEMHGDGGVFTQVFFHAFVVDPRKAVETAVEEDGRKRPKGGRVFVIRHDKVEPEPKQIDRSLKPVIGRAIASMVKAMALADLYFIYLEAQEANTQFNYVAIPADFVWGSEQEFDTAEMNRLYQIGYDMARDGHEWETRPPQFDQSPLAGTE